MAKQTINTGNSANDGTGDTLRNSFVKVNQNFTEVYNNVANNQTLTIAAFNQANTGNPGYITLTNTGTLSNVYSGAAYTFVHPNNSETVDNIAANVAITRGAQKGLYNPITDASYDDSTNNHEGTQGIISNTEWYKGFWGDFSDVTSKTYTTWLSAVNNPPDAVGAEMIMHDLENDTYYAFKFLSWQSSAQGGGFSYTRQLINTVTPVVFTKTDNGSEVDYIDTDVAITRGSNQGPYNPLVDEGWNADFTPSNTLWNTQGWDDLSDVTTRNYVTFYAALGAANGIGPSAPFKELVMKDTVNNKYYKIQFLEYHGSGAGGGFKYTRELIDTDNPQVGIKFADGTSQKTAIDGIIGQHHSNNNIDYYLKKEDAGKHIFMEDGQSIRVPNNQHVPFKLGTTIVLVSGDSSLYVYPDDSPVKIYGAGLGTDSSQNNNLHIPARSIATIIKIAEDDWMLSGAGLST